MLLLGGDGNGRDRHVGRRSESFGQRPQMPNFEFNRGRGRFKRPLPRDARLWGWKRNIIATRRPFRLVSPGRAG